MLNPQKTAATHADSFIQRYERLRAWALQLAERDQERADDLLHDAFIQFTLSHPDLDSIADLDSYLYVCLRNLHLSQMRRATRTASRELSIIEYDSAELGLWAIDPRDQIKTQDELRTVCHYACRRRKTSKAGSVLILRFFHGYYPEEVASVLRITRPAVKDRLRLARAEAKLYLTDSGQLNLLHDKQIEERPRAEVGRISGDLLKELRQSIFDSCEGSCFSRSQLEEFYAPEGEGTLSVDVVGHIVTCAKCLDEVNKILGLPLLAERYASDMTGKDTRKKGGPRGGPSGKGGGGLKESLNSYVRRARQVYRHEPQELCVAVNGYLQSTQKISSPLNELTLIVDTAEQIGFVEVFSEQGVRLLLLNIEPLPAGSVRQDVRVELSDGRTLEASLSFSGAWPKLHVIYQDPLAQESSEQRASEEDLLIGPTLAAKTSETEPAGDVAESKSQAIDRSRSNFLSRASEWSRRIIPPGFWLRPVTITAVFAVFMLVAFTLLWRSKPTPLPSAADVLQRATAAEEVAVAQPDTVIHRTFQLEERRGSIEGEILTSQRVEVWQSAAKGITARRLYDSSGRLLAGEWTRSDNVSTLYAHGVRPRIQIRDPQSAIRNSELWQLSPSAKDFAAIAGEPRSLRLEERGNQYVLTLESGSQSAEQKLIKATLVIGRDDLHAIEQTLTVQRNGGIHVYRLSETSFERKPVNAVAPAVFEPESELLSSLQPDDARRSELETRNPKPETGSFPVSATPELEVEVLRLLNQAGADMGEQINVTRSPEGQLQVQGIVETDNRKREILRVLDPVRNNPAANIQINSVAEVLQRQPKTADTSGPIVIERANSAANTNPVDAELRSYFAKKGESEEQAAASARRFANRVVGQSGQVLQHAWAVKRLTERFSPEQLRNLGPEARANWLAMIKAHCRSFQQLNASMRQELQTVFFPGSPSDNTEPEIEIKDDGDLVRAAERLLGICASNDKLISAAFTVSSRTSGASAIKAPQFARSLKSAEMLAAKIGAVARQ